jgi:hypothetical protein
LITSHLGIIFNTPNNIRTTKTPRRGRTAKREVGEKGVGGGRRGGRWEEGGERWERVPPVHSLTQV